MKFTDPYVYRLHVTEVYDGDTVYGTLDLGFGHKWEAQRFRLWGINCPEIRSKDAEEKAKGLQAKQWLETQLWAKDYDVYVQTKLNPHGRETFGKFGRILGILWLQLDENSISLNEMMVRTGLAKPYMDDGVYQGVLNDYHNANT